MPIVETALHDTDAGLLCSGQGGGRIVMEVHDGWVEVLVLFYVHNRRSWTRFEGISMDEKGRKRVNVEFAGAGCT